MLDWLVYNYNNKKLIKKLLYFFYRFLFPLRYSTLTRWWPLWPIRWTLSRWNLTIIACSDHGRSPMSSALTERGERCGYRLALYLQWIVQIASISSSYSLSLISFSPHYRISLSLSLCVHLLIRMAFFRRASLHFQCWLDRESWQKHSNSIITDLLFGGGQFEKRCDYDAHMYTYCSLRCGWLVYSDIMWSAVDNTLYYILLFVIIKIKWKHTFPLINLQSQIMQWLSIH